MREEETRDKDMGRQGAGRASPGDRGVMPDDEGDLAPDDEMDTGEMATLDEVLSRRLPPSDAKVQRWIDLLAALLVRQTPATFAELRREVPAYGASDRANDAVARMFERDKDELRRCGVPIVTVDAGDDGGAMAYRLPSQRYYLPYLALAARSVREQPPATAPVGRGQAGYPGPGQVLFSPEMLLAIADAVERVRALGDPVLSEECEWGARKLALELPLPDARRAGAAGRGDIVLPSSRPTAAVFERLTDAVTRRKRCTIGYYSIGRDAVATRTVEPYGLFFLSGHWYLAARDPALDDVRNFRLSRVREVSVNDRQAQRPDYDIPSSFVLRQHAAERQPWELGDASEQVVAVDVMAWTGATRAAARLSQATDDGATRRHFRVRRMDAFARWLMAFGGDMVPVSPPALVAEWSRMVRETLRRYEDSPPAEHTA